MKLIALSVPLVALAAVGAVVAGGDSSSCGYNEDGTYMSADGQSAFGTMTAAAACAADGKLPGVVAARLGVLGDEEIRQRAEEIKKMDAKVRRQHEKGEAGQA